MRKDPDELRREAQDRRMARDQRRAAIRAAARERGLARVMRVRSQASAMRGAEYVGRHPSMLGVQQLAEMLDSPRTSGPVMVAVADVLMELAGIIEPDSLGIIGTRRKVRRKNVEARRPARRPDIG